MTTGTDGDRDLHAYVDGELDPGRRAALAARLARDPTARGRVDAYAAQRGLLREAWEALPDRPGDARTAALTEELARRLEDRRPGPANPAGAGRRGLRRALLPAALAACALVGWVARDAAHDAWDPAPEDGSRAAPGPPAAAGILAIPSLDGLGMRLVGGTVTGTPEGVLAHLVYEGAAGARVTLSISPSPRGGGVRPVLAERDGVRLAYWSGAHRSYVATTASRGVALDAVIAALAPAADAPG